MKKIIFTLVVSLFAFAAFAKDMPIQPNQLPANAQGGNIVKIDRDFGYFDVKLQNNIELKIDMNGKILKKELD